MEMAALSMPSGHAAPAMASCSSSSSSSPCWAPPCAWLSLDGFFGAAAASPSRCSRSSRHLRCRSGKPCRPFVPALRELEVRNSPRYRCSPSLESQLPAENDEEENSAAVFESHVLPASVGSGIREGEGGGRGGGGGGGDQKRIPYGLITGLASVGFVETAYLTWAKIAGTTVTCPVGAGSCTDVLDSSYAIVFGIPLAFVGMVAYGAIALVGGIRLSSNSSDWEEEEKRVRWLVLAGTTSMAAASAYFMYILTTKLEGTSCAYCVSSAMLSFSLLLSAIRGFSVKDVGLMAGVQVAVGASVVLGLSVAFGDSNAAFARSQELDLPSVEPEVLTVSSPRVISLAKHLHSVGARMYGAFWCSHCFEQKQMFGREAMKYLDYVECYPDGYRKGVQIAESCDSAKIQGFPTWIINGKSLSGEQDLEDLARASGFDESIKFK